MTAEIFLFPAVRGSTLQQEDNPLPLYELYWKRSGDQMCISSRDPDRIVRQMESLAARGICASVYADGWPCGGVGGGDVSGPQQVSFYPATPAQTGQA